MSVRMTDIGQVMLRGQRERPGRLFRPDFHAIDEHESAGGWRGGAEQQRMVAARSRAADGSGRESAKPVSFEPFRNQVFGLVRWPTAQVSPAASVSVTAWTGGGSEPSSERFSPSRLSLHWRPSRRSVTLGGSRATTSSPSRLSPAANERN